MRASDRQRAALRRTHQLGESEEQYTERIRTAGYAPQVDLATGIRRYLDWIRQQADVRDYFSEAANILRSKGIVHRVKGGDDRRG